eukprot:365001-Chlamydomonas_euryale.AAC.13
MLRQQWRNQGTPSRAPPLTQHHARPCNHVKTEVSAAQQLNSYKTSALASTALCIPMPRKQRAWRALASDQSEHWQAA